MRQWMIRAKDALKRQEPVVLIFALLLVCLGWALTGRNRFVGAS